MHKFLKKSIRSTLDTFDLYNVEGVPGSERAPEPLLSIPIDLIQRARYNYWGVFSQEDTRKLTRVFNLNTQRVRMMKWLWENKENEDIRFFMGAFLKHLKSFETRPGEPVRVIEYLLMMRSNNIRSLLRYHGLLNDGNDQLITPLNDQLTNLFDGNGQLIGQFNENDLMDRIWADFHQVNRMVSFWRDDWARVGGILENMKGLYIRGYYPGWFLFAVTCSFLPGPGDRELLSFCASLLHGSYARTLSGRKTFNFIVIFFMFLFLSLFFNYFEPSFTPDTNTNKVIGTLFHFVPRSLRNYLAFFFVGIIERFKGDRNYLTPVFIVIFMAFLSEKTGPELPSLTTSSGLPDLINIFKLYSLQYIPPIVFTVLFGTLRQAWDYFYGGEDLYLIEEKGRAHFILVFLFGFIMYKLPEMHYGADTSLPSSPHVIDTDFSLYIKISDDSALDDAYFIGTVERWCKLTHPPSMQYWANRIVKSVSGVSWGGDDLQKFCLLMEDLNKNKDELVPLLRILKNKFETETLVSGAGWELGKVRTYERVHLFLFFASLIFTISGFIEQDVQMLDRPKLGKEKPNIPSDIPVETQTRLMVWYLIDHAEKNPKYNILRGDMKKVFNSPEMLRDTFNRIGTFNGDIQKITLKMIQDELKRATITIATPRLRAISSVLFRISPSLPVIGTFLKTLTLSLEKQFPPLDPLNRLEMRDQMRVFREFVSKIPEGTTRQIEEIRDKNATFFETLEREVQGILGKIGDVLTQGMKVIFVLAILTGVGYKKLKTLGVIKFLKMAHKVYKLIEPFDFLNYMWRSMYSINRMFIIETSQILDTDIDRYIWGMNCLNLTGLSFFHFMYDYIIESEYTFLLGPKTKEVQQFWFLSCIFFHLALGYKYDVIRKVRGQRVLPEVKEEENSSVTTLDKKPSTGFKNGVPLDLQGLFSKKNIS